MSVYKAIDIIATSPVSWKQAATEAVERARAGVDDTRVARSSSGTGHERSRQDHLPHKA